VTDLDPNIVWLTVINLSRIGWGFIATTELRAFTYAGPRALWKLHKSYRRLAKSLVAWDCTKQLEIQ
jgi:hypothetical protein